MCCLYEGIFRDGSTLPHSDKTEQYMKIYLQCIAYIELKTNGWQVVQYLVYISVLNTFK